MKARGASRAHFRLLIRATELDLAPGTTLVVGRDASCGVVLDDPRASRRHAEIKTTELGCTLTDLGSINGTFLNGEPVRGTRVLVAGDRILFAQTEGQIVDGESRRRSTGTTDVGGSSDSSASGAPAEVPSNVRSSGARAKPPPPAPSAPLASSGIASAGRPPLTPRPELLADDPTVVTGRLDSLQLFGKLADQAFAEGDESRASQLLSAQFRAIFGAAQRRGSVPPDSLDFVARYALRLSLVTNDSSWIDATFRVFTTVKRPVPAELVEELRGALRRLPPLDRAVLRDYVEALRGTAHLLSASERFVVQALAMLERLI